MPQLLLELFSEEIPARMQAQAAKDLERMAREHLAAAGFLPEALKTFAGPRRLTLVAEGLPLAQADRKEALKGPRVGAPPQAMEGFLRKAGLTQDQLVERDGVWMAFIDKKGRPTPEIVAEMVETIVRGFPWPKSMVWGTKKLRWVRPLKRILCVLNREVVPFALANESLDRIVESTTVTLPDSSSPRTTTSLNCAAISTPRLRTSPTFWTKLTGAMTPGSVEVCAISASRMFSWNSDTRSSPLDDVRANASSPLVARSGFRSGFGDTKVEPVETIWYSSLTVGKRTALPSDAVTRQSGANCQANVVFGDTALADASGCSIATPPLKLKPSLACQRSPRRPSVASQFGANVHASCTHSARVRVLPLPAV